jgi:lipopolysaccharide biosynthesis protein
MVMSQKLRALAVYLPQFHSIPENDVWWGSGFTDWEKVKMAQPLFKVHYQPHIPADLGYYDLRVPEIREKQAKMAHDHGIYGFCYYHYWFNGKRLLNRPIDEILSMGKPDFPFCLCWANEDWSRRWDGSQNEILVKHDYNHEDDRKHIQFLFSFFKDPRYIKIDGRPLFIIYKPELFPDINGTVKIWREEARKEGLGELYLCYFENGIRDVSPETISFDSSAEFQPCWHKIPKRKLLHRVFHKLNKKKYLTLLDYRAITEIMQQSQLPKYKRFPCVTPGWDNTARRKYGALIMKDSTPEIYSKWLRTTVQRFKPYSSEENFIFINAWNEWAEGNHLEPCQKWGRTYLEETRKIFLPFI